MKTFLYPVFTFIYIVLCVIIMAAGYWELTWTYYLTKPLAMLMLLFFFRMRSAEKMPGTDNKSIDRHRSFRNFIMVGLLFSAMGDVILMFSEKNEQYFIAGLVIFLFAHISYTTGFIAQIFSNRPWSQHWGQLAFSTVIVVYGAEFFILNRSSFGSMYFPVLIYSIAITTMGVAAVMRDRFKNRLGYFRVVIGAVFFIISDSLLATDKFVVPVENSGLLILSTYFFAQYMIITGCLVDISVPAKKPAENKMEFSETSL